MLNRPTRVVVTGAAGFIGSHLCDRLLADGHEVVGIDSFSDYYERRVKDQSLRHALTDPRFTLVHADLVDADLSRALTGAKVIFHLAGQPGVRPSWGDHFDRYVHDNIVATQRLLEAVRAVPIDRLVFASSSSVYGDAAMFPTKGTALTRPASPSGMSTLAAAQLAVVRPRQSGARSARRAAPYGSLDQPRARAPGVGTARLVTRWADEAVGMVPRDVAEEPEGRVLLAEPSEGQIPRERRRLHRFLAFP